MSIGMAIGLLFAVGASLLPLASTQGSSLFTSSEKSSRWLSCAVESAARLNPDKRVVLHSNTWTDQAVRHLPPNVRIQRFNLPGLFHGTPLLGWFRNIARWKKGFPLNNLSNGIRLAMLFKYGGTYLDTDMIVVKNLAQSQYQSAQLERQTKVNWKFCTWKATTASRSTQLRLWTSTLNAFVQLLMKRFVEEFAGDVWMNGPGLLTRTWNDWNNDLDSSGDSKFNYFLKTFTQSSGELSHFSTRLKNTKILSSLCQEALQCTCGSHCSHHTSFRHGDFCVINAHELCMSNDTQYFPSLRAAVDRTAPNPHAFAARIRYAQLQSHGLYVMPSLLSNNLP